MKKIISFLCVTMVILSISINVLAGSIPEDLLHSDDAQIFFAEVVYYHPDKENPDIEVSPIKVIKGDVKTGGKLTYYNPNTVGDFKVKVGNVYLFTYFDENNPTDIFDVTSYNTLTLKLKNTEADMWKRFEKYLNEGRYEEAELERTGRLSARVLSELFIFDESDVDKIEVIYPGDGDPCGCYVDKSEFFDIAETIPLIPNKRIDEMDENNGVLIVAVNKNDERTSVWLDNKGRVGCNAFETSSSTITQYDISRDDYIKMYALLPEEATAHIPLENPMKKYVVGTSLFAGLIFVTAFVIAYCVKKKRG